MQGVSQAFWEDDGFIQLGETTTVYVNKID